MSIAPAAQAEMPSFTAQCPMGLSLEGDPSGTLRVNGAIANVRMFNPTYYEASAGGITFSISTEEDGSGLYVMYEPPGNPGGVCTITSVGMAPAQADTTAGAGGPDHFRVEVGSRLLVHSRPSTSSPTVAKLPSGMVVQNLGCQQSEGRTWCHIADGDASGWAAGEFLVEASGPIRSARATPVVQGGSSSHTFERVRFPRGQTGTEFTDELNASESRRYVLGARSGQFLYFRLAANGPGMTYVIYNPDGSVLQDEVSATQEYRGQLWQSGDHTVEVYNTANGAQSFNVIFGIE
jgi:hypothetical protein